jgi:hypothetical protein
VLAAFLLNNGQMYHIANSIAVTEYLLVLYSRPSLKSFPYVSSIGKSYEFFQASHVTYTCLQALLLCASDRSCDLQP